VVWCATADTDHPYDCQLDGQHWQIRINDFPEELLYSLLVDGIELARFNDWPAAWRKPGA